jgi:hypothetical protein
MGILRCSLWPVLAAAVLANSAPVPPRPTLLRITASDCSCASEPLLVRVDGAPVGTLTCRSTDEALSVKVTPGSHFVSAKAGGVSWPVRSYSARRGTGRSVGDRRRHDHHPLQRLDDSHAGDPR